MPVDPPEYPETRHATAVSLDGTGVLIEGPTGSGKSGLALGLVALGAVLISDDQTRIAPHDGRPHLWAPDRLAGVIEARFVGLLRVAHVERAPLGLIVDLGQRETSRLPPHRTRLIGGWHVPVIHGVDAPHFAASIVALVKGGRWDDD